MKIEHISKVIITAEHATRAQKQNLTQKERKLLHFCCNVFDNPNQEIKPFVGEKEQLKKLITKLQTEIPNPPKICCLAKMISFYV